MRLRKFIGTIITVSFLLIYCLMAMVLAARLLPGTSGVVQLGYYAVAGLLWVIPVGLLIKWMQRE
ncbi:DUF2842 domain-containing protein [Acuticoccus yangtzensis]|uniref:DUF2842 domain-containing protein n=1 Tax=Acuticoccus yangtzensis TaxID=1443441 RepID=UPI00094980B0|nr:DUF2842 domain-containing protein [Acuticoccus yangtzensis]ORE91237.1 hypothetical protein ATO13_20929 [Stappia sp. 22II-S9-Z10]